MKKSFGVRRLDAEQTRLALEVITPLLGKPQYNDLLKKQKGEEKCATTGYRSIKWTGQRELVEQASVKCRALDLGHYIRLGFFGTLRVIAPKEFSVSNEYKNITNLDAMLTEAYEKSRAIQEARQAKAEAEYERRRCAAQPEQVNREAAQQTRREVLRGKVGDELGAIAENLSDGVKAMPDLLIHMGITTQMAELHNRHGDQAVIEKLATILACMSLDGGIEMRKLLNDLNEAAHMALVELSETRH